jgi:pimeloyl-ACP methyl ester carboxylesterase
LGYQFKMNEVSNSRRIQFAHANGFPARTYTKLFRLLENDFEINFIEKHGHNPQFPVTDNWKFLARELQNEIENRYKGEPIIGIGHSLGGILHYLVACENPDLYSQIILLDAPIISRLSSFALRLAKKTNLIERFSPSRITRFRRNLWKTREEAFQHFKAKEKFAAFDEAVLRDYIDHGLIENNRGFELFFEPSIEAKIYDNVPHTLPQISRSIDLPITYIGGTDSREGKLAGVSSMKRIKNLRFETITGSHLFPFENPEATANLILKTLK